MPISGLVIHRFAHLFIQLHGEKATAKARKMMEEMRRKGDHEGANTWLYIIESMASWEEPSTWCLMWARRPKAASNSVCAACITAA